MKSINIGSKKAEISLAASVSLITFVIYLFSLRNDFMKWDDGTYITNNPHIRSLDLAFFKWSFSDFYAANWHPLTWISHALDYAVWGLNPLGHHLTNNILHAVNTFIVVLLVARLMKAAKAPIPSSPPVLGGVSEGRGGNRNEVLLPDKPPLPLLNQGGELKGRAILIAAATTGLLFGLHPIHVESVAWVAERKDLLCALFYLLSILKYMSYRTYKTYTAYFLSLLFFTLALLSKPMAVSLPLVLLILDWFPFNRVHSLKTFRTALVGKIPFIALSVVSSIVTIMAQKSGGAMYLMEVVPLSSRLLVASQSLSAYMWKIVLPLKLIPYYPYPKSVSLFSPQFFPALVLAIGITTVCILTAKKHKIPAALWGYYLATLFPVLGIVQVGGQAMADRYAYLPGCGPSLLIGLLLAWIYNKADSLRKWGAVFKIAYVTGALIILVSMSYLTVKQIGIWEKDITLWDYVISKEPEKVPMAYFNRGKLYQEIGRPDKGLADCAKAIALDPFYAEAYNVRGDIFESLGQSDKALSDYETAIALDPSSYGPHYNRGIIFGKLGRLDEALADYNRAISLNPSFYEAYVNRGNVLTMLQQAGPAIADYNMAIALNPYRYEAYMNRAILFLKIGERERAVFDFKAACAMGHQGACDSLNRLQSSLSEKYG